MKKYKTIILSALLFALTFFTFHDYVLESIDTDTQYELCYLKYDKNALDNPSKIHNSMHTMFDVVVFETLVETIFTPTSKPMLLEKKFLSYTNSVLQRPPLS